jgi:hypothetical protein
MGKAEQFLSAMIKEAVRNSVRQIGSAMRREDPLLHARSVGSGIRNRTARDAGRLRHTDRGPEAIADER